MANTLKTILTRLVLGFVILACFAPRTEAGILGARRPPARVGWWLGGSSVGVSPAPAPTLAPNTQSSLGKNTRAHPIKQQADLMGSLSVPQAAASACVLQ